MIVTFQPISGMMLGLEFIAGGMVLDILILRIMFLSKDSPYIQYDDE